MTDPDTLPESVRQAFFDSKLFKKYVASLHLTEGIKTLEEQDTLYEQVVRDVTDRCSNLRSEDSVREVLTQLVHVVEDHTSLVDSDIDKEDLDALLETAAEEDA